MSIRFSISVRQIVVALASALASALTSITTVAHAAAPRIVLHPHVEVTGAQITLNDVAELSARDLPTLRRLMRAPLGHAPRAGESVTWTQADVAQRVSGIAGPAHALEWQGDAAVTVTRPLHVVAGHEVERVAQHALLAALPTYGLPASPALFNVISPPLDTRLPDVSAHTVTLQARAPVIVRGIRPHATVWIDVRAGQRVVRSVPVRYSLDSTAPAPVLDTARAVSTPSTPYGLNATTTHANTTNALATRISTTRSPIERSTAGNSFAERSVAARTPLAKPSPTTEPTARAAIRDTGDTIRVTQGETIRVRMRDGALSIERPAVALHDSIAGEPVQVRITPGMPPVTARLIARGFAEVTTP